MFNNKHIKNWFGYDRKERRAAFILLVIIVVIILVRYLYPQSKNDVEDISALLVKETVSYPVSYGTMVPQKTNPSRQERTAVKKQINLNSCDSATLESLPGIGPVLSARIIKYRNLIGGYASVEQLREVYGLPPETYALIQSRVFADTSMLRHINVNTAEYRDLDMLPYIRRYEIYSIIRYRDIYKRIGSIEELVNNKIIPDSTARKIRPYVVF